MLSAREKHPDREVDYASSCSPEVKMKGAMPPLPPVASWRVEGKKITCAVFMLIAFFPFCDFELSWLPFGTYSCSSGYRLDWHEVRRPWIVTVAVGGLRGVEALRFVV